MNNQSIIRTLAHHPHSKLELSEVKKSPKEEEEDPDGNALKVVMETDATRKAREKAEWERLSFVEKIVKKIFPSQINSIAIFVNESI